MFIINWGIHPAEEAVHPGLSYATPVTHTHTQTQTERETEPALSAAMTVS